MPKAAAVALSVISMVAAVALLLARQWIGAGVAIALAIAFDLLLVRTLLAERAARSHR
jgi:hypothetical protein